MNTKRFWISFIVIFILLEVTNYIIHMGILGSTYAEESIKQLFRPEEEMQSKMWIVWLMDLVWTYFFTFIFVKGYENKGLMEGLKYGIYMGLFVMMVLSYQAYAMYPIPYSLAFQWFIYGFIQCIIFGLVVAAIYKPKEAVESSGD